MKTPPCPAVVQIARNIAFEERFNRAQGHGGRVFGWEAVRLLKQLRAGGSVTVPPRWLALNVQTIIEDHPDQTPEVRRVLNALSWVACGHDGATVNLPPYLQTRPTLSPSPRR